MMTITNVSDIRGFDPQIYSNLIDEAKAQGVSTAQVDHNLIGLIESGRDFGKAVAELRFSIIQLPPPLVDTDLARISELGVMPSPGSLVLSLITKYATEQRQQNAEIRQQQVDAIAKSMIEEADKMRDMAAAQLALSIASGVITIASGAIQAGMAGAALATKPGAVDTKGLNDKQISSAKSAELGRHSAELTLKNTKASGVSQGMGGFSTILNAASEYIGTTSQAKFKEMEADQEKMRAAGEAVKNLDDGLKELIQKALSAQDAIQQGQNQARLKILG
jgi:hypothetical protein